MSPVLRKIVVNDQGEPLEVIIPWESFCEIAEAFGWDLDAEAIEDLRATRREMENSHKDTFIPLSSL